MDDNGDMTSPITVRHPTVSDATGMSEVHVEAWRTGYRGLLADEFLDGMDLGRRIDAWVHALSTDDGTGAVNLVAEVDGRIAGISTYGPYRDTPDPDRPSDLSELWMLNVHPQYWGAGVAQLLIAAAVDGLRSEWDRPRAALWVLDGNARGRRFYEKQGWTGDGATKEDDIGGRTVTELRYVIDL